MHDLRHLILDHMALGVAGWLPRFDEQTGRFITPPAGPIAPGATPADLGFCVINQDILYPLATLYAAPDSPHHDDPRFLHLALRAGDAIRDFQYPDGQVEFLKSDGSRWGPTYMCWTNYAWLETYALLREELGEERRARWEEGLTLAHDGQAREIANGHVHNIPTWKAMSCYRAGQLFGREDWQRAGVEMIRLTLATQTPDGYWPEHGGPSTLYNLVYVHALGLHYLHSQDAGVLPALRAALDFHQTFTYPDGAVVETIDGRVKYHARVSTFAWASFSLFPDGRAYTRRLVEHFATEEELHSFQGGCLASAYHHVQEGPTEPCLLDQRSLSRRQDDWALVRREGPWYACLSAFVCPPVNSRWGQDRQSFVSLWHERTGLLIGGGNSKIQPEWSTFAAGGRYMPDAGSLTGEGIALQYGDVRCTLAVELEAEAAVLKVRAEQGLALHSLVLNLKRGQRLLTAGGADLALGDDIVHLAGTDLGAWVQWDECRIELPPGAELRWPSYAYNPYAIDAAPPTGSEMGVLSVRLDNSEAVWRISLVD